MRGIILAGGEGTRLLPITKVTNKHLLPIYDKPMIYYPLQTLIDAGIKDVLIVTGGNDAGDFLKLLGNGREFGINIQYTYQVGSGGIADALLLAESFANKDNIIVILGDNITDANIGDNIKRFERAQEGAMILTKRVGDPERFGVVSFNSDREIVKITEKPSLPDSDVVISGIYMYDNKVFDIIRKLKPSYRGELEITDVNNAYLERKQLMHNTLDGYWTDAGTFKSLYRANKLIAEGV